MTKIVASRMVKIKECVFVLIVDGDAVGVYTTREGAIRHAIKYFEDRDLTISKCSFFELESVQS